MEILLNILLSKEFITIFGSFIVALVTSKITSRNDRKKQTIQFFKEKGIDEQNEMLDFWSMIAISGDYETTIKAYQYKRQKDIVRAFNLKGTDDVNDVYTLKYIINKSFKYSSKKTVKCVGRFVENSNKGKKSKSNMRNLVLGTKVICAMRHDFTGERSSVMDFLKLNINDLDFKKKMKIRWYIVETRFR